MNPSTERRPLPSPRRALALTLALAFAFAFAFAISPAPALAQESRAGDHGVQAIERGREGIELYKRGSWNDAIEAFRQAEALFHSPVFVLYMARSLRNAGRLLEARSTFERLVGERLDSSAPELWKKAQVDAGDELKALEANVPSVIIVVEGGTASTRTTLDGRPVAPGAVIELDPGTHRLDATDSGRSKQQVFAVSAGARRQRITVQLAPSNAVAPSQPLEPEHPRPGGPSIPGLIGVGVGGAAK
jgi:hypothetical protein